MRVLFRCDARPESGLGHLARSLALAEEALGRGWQVSIDGTIEVSLARAMCRRLGVEVSPPSATLEELLAHADRVGADVVHIDDYDLPSDGLSVFIESGSIVSSMEDGEYGRRPAHLVIDSRPGSHRSYRPIDGSTRALRGVDYLPLRSAVLAHPGWEGPRHVPRILVAMGGTDPFRVGWHLVRAVRDGLPDAEVHVISASPGGDEAELRERVVAHHPTESVAALFGAMDLVISGAGTTTWELAHLGVPSALVLLADNQAENYRIAVAAGLAKGLGSADSLMDSASDAIDTVRGMVTDPGARRQMSLIGRRLVDGAGSRRIVDAWVAAAQTRSGLVLRPAEPGDASQLFEWRREDAVRAVSRDREPLEWPVHLAWFEAALGDPSRLVFIAQIDARPAGTVRFASVDEEWEVSITVAPEFRRKRLASAILAKGERVLRQAVGPATIVATVDAANLPSRRLFAASGYEPRKADAGATWTHWRKFLD